MGEGQPNPNFLKATGHSLTERTITESSAPGRPPEISLGEGDDVSKVPTIALHESESAILLELIGKAP